MKNFFKKTIVLVVLSLTFFTSRANVIILKSNTENDVSIKLNDIKKGQKWLLKGEKLELKGRFKTITSGEVDLILKSLNNGEYQLDLDKDFIIERLSFILKDGIVKLLKKKTIFKPVIRMQGNRIFVSNHSFDKDNFQIIVLYEKKKIFDEKIQNEENSKRIIKLSKETKGRYKVITKYGDKTLSKSFYL